MSEISIQSWEDGIIGFAHDGSDRVAVVRGDRYIVVGPGGMRLNIPRAGSESAYAAEMADAFARFSSGTACESIMMLAPGLRAYRAIDCTDLFEAHGFVEHEGQRYRLLRKTDNDTYAIVLGNDVIGTNDKGEVL
jgi:hypothetical protein